jgi:hypothetical protein
MQSNFGPAVPLSVSQEGICPWNLYLRDNNWLVGRNTYVVRRLFQPLEQIRKSHALKAKEHFLCKKHMIC